MNRSVLSRDLKVPIVSANLVDGDRELQTVSAAIDNENFREGTEISNRTIVCRVALVQCRFFKIGTTCPNLCRRGKMHAVNDRLARPASNGVIAYRQI